MINYTITLRATYDSEHPFLLSLPKDVAMIIATLIHRKENFETTKKSCDRENHSKYGELVGSIKDMVKMQVRERGSDMWTNTSEVYTNKKHQAQCILSTCVY